MTIRAATGAGLEQLLDAFNDLLVVADLEGRFVEVNRAWEPVLGWTSKELLSKPFIEFVHPDDRASTTAAAALLAAGGQVQTFRNRYVTRAGGYRWLNWSAVGAPKEGRIYAIARDETDRIRAEERLQESEAYRRQLLNNVVHDLKLGLTPIRSQLDLLSMPGHGREPDRILAVAMMSRNLDRVQRLISDLADVALLDAGQLRLRRAPVILSQIVSELLEDVRLEAQKKGIDLEFDARDATRVDGDADRLRQVAMNLMANALRFTPQGGRIGVQVMVQGGRAVFRVKDTGRGLTPQEAQRLFKPFSQVHGPNEVVGLGTGLGLFICKGIAEAHGGNVSVQSEGRGKGSVFTVTLPMVEDGVSR